MVAAMRTASKLLHNLTHTLFAERKSKGLYPADMQYKELSQQERNKLRAEAQKLLFKDRLV
jgi:hypothetical protein